MTILCVVFVFSSRRRHTRCALVTGVQTCALPISRPDMSAEYDLARDASMRWFLDFVGRDTPVTSITKRTVRDWVAALRKFPSRGSLFKENEGATFQEIVARNESQQRPVIRSGERRVGKEGVRTC